jgi:protein-disulfide isomerase
VLGTEPEIKARYVKTGQVKLVFNPILDHGDHSVQAHQAAECAGEQSMFWSMHDRLFAEQGSLFGGDPREMLKMHAAELGLDSAAFNACLDEQRYLEKVTAQDNYRREIGIRTRPTLDINGQLVVGPQPFPAFEAVIEPLLTQ